MIKSFAFVLVAATAGVAVAQPAAPQTAEEHYEAGKRFYAVNEFDKAIAEFKTAYTLQADPNILFNIAQAMRKKGDCVGAIEFYTKFLKESPNAPNRAKVEGWISELDACAKAQPRPVEPTPVEPAPPPRPKPPPSKPVVVTPEPLPPGPPPHHTSRLRIAGVATSAVGGALLVGGTVLAISARGIAKDVEDACNGTAGCDWAMQRELDQRGQDRATQSKLLFALGTTAVAGGVVMWFLGKPGHEAPVALVPTTSGGLLVTGGRF